jgi:nucleotide-binding universal stress UspA family protein
MTYRSLLVHLGPDALCAARTRTAIRLARDLDAHLVGVAPTGLISVPIAEEVAASLPQFATLAWDIVRQTTQDLIHQFRDACTQASLASFEAVLDESGQAPSLVQRAHCSDLVVMSQPDPGVTGHAFARDILEDVVLNSARPTLVLPYAGDARTVGTRVMVAWDDSQEAARALSDALPLLRLARHVDVVRWIEHGQHDDPSLRARLDTLHRWLQRHGVAADMHVETAGIQIAEAMLSHAADQGTDLIVMGAYGHARWSERVFGGATRGLLQSMTVPVLMSR